MTGTNTLFFAETQEADFEKLGGKGKSLARMAIMDFPVPPGFCITTDAYAQFLNATGMRTYIQERIENIDIHSIENLENTASAIRDLIIMTPMPEGIEQEIEDAYHKLAEACSVPGLLPVAVRSSATAEDLADASFAGQQDTYLYISGAPDVVDHVKKCWASLYTSRAIMYRKAHSVSEADLLMCVVIQKMANARAAGVVMTLNPINGDKSKIIIDSAWGLGEALVSGEITPDNFIVDKVILEIIAEKIHCKPFELITDSLHKKLIKAEIEPDRAAKASITREEVLRISRLAKTLEKKYGFPLDIEWALDRDLPEGKDLMLLQSRPETVWSQKKKQAPSLRTGMDSLVNTLMNPVSSSTNQ